MSLGLVFFLPQDGQPYKHVKKAWVLPAAEEEQWVARGAKRPLKQESLAQQDPFHSPVQ